MYIPDEHLKHIEITEVMGIVRLPKGNIKPTSRMTEGEKAVFYYDEALRYLKLAMYWLDKA